MYFLRYLMQTTVMVFVVYQTLYTVYNIVQSMHECGYDTPYHDYSNNVNNRDVECKYF